MDISVDLIKQLPFLAILTPLVLFFQQSRNFMLKIFRIFWKERVIPQSFSYEFYKGLKTESFSFNFDDYDLNTSWYYHLLRKQHLPIVFKRFNFELLFYKNIIPIFIFGYQAETIKIQYFKGTFPFERFFTDVINQKHEELNVSLEKKKKNRGRFYVEEKRGMGLKLKMEKGSTPLNDSNKNNDSGQITGNSSNNYKYPIVESYRIITDKIPLSIGVDINNVSWNTPYSEKNKYIFTKTGLYILSQVEKWLNAEKWYEEKNIVWKRGMLLNGKPGNGKSTLILEIAKKLEIPLFIFDLSTMDNGEFDSKLEDLPKESCIVLFEDFDSIFNGRTNVVKTKYGGVTFDCFINKLSGANCIKNKFVFITTNHIEKIDPAILRSGRCDEKIEIEMLNKEEKTKMAAIILENNQDLINRVIEESDNDSTADFENRCVRLALEKFWNNK